MRKDKAMNSGSGGNKSLTIVTSRGLQPIAVDPRASMGIINVEIRPHERWAGVSTVPLRDFCIFNLPQDVVAYNGREKDELVDRCLG